MTTAQYLNRPNLEYQYVFDICAMTAYRSEGPIAVFASKPFYARELLTRLAGCDVKLVATGGWAESAASGDWLWPEVGQADFRNLDLGSEPVQTVIWAEPLEDSQAQTWQQIVDIVYPQGRLLVLSSGWTARFMPEWQQDQDQNQVASPGRLRQLMKESGLRVQDTYGFHGPVSLAWAYAYRAMQRLKREDLADRCLHRMHATYVTTGWQIPLSTVSLRLASFQR